MPKDKKEAIAFNVSRLPINKASDLVAYWEMYMDVSGEIPDKVVMNERQFIWYQRELIRFAELNKLKFDPRKVTFRSLAIETN